MSERQFWKPGRLLEKCAPDMSAASSAVQTRRLDFKPLAVLNFSQAALAVHLALCVSDKFPGRSFWS